MSSGALLDRGRPHLGIGVSVDAVRGVLVVKGKVIKATIIPIIADESLTVVLDRLWHELKPTWSRRPLVSAAIGPAATQVRRLSGLPRISDGRAVSALVRESAGRFFLKNGIPLLTSRARADSPGVAWVAAFDEPVVRSVVTFCATRGLRFRLALPALVSIGYALESVPGSVECRDGDVIARAAYDHNTLIESARGRSDEEHCPREVSPQYDVSSPLAELGPGATNFVDAYGATQVGTLEPLAITAGDVRLWASKGVPRWRVTLASVAFALALVLSFLAPVARAWREEVRARHQLAQAAPKYRGALWTERELDKTTAALEDIEQFERQRRSLTLLLADLTHALSESSSLMSLRVDAEGGDLVALAPRGALLLSELADAQEITAPKITGPLTSETRGTTRLERATIQFRWRGRVRAPRVVQPPRGLK
jgi:hypothetical protein